MHLQVPVAIAAASSAMMIAEFGLTRLLSIILPYYFVYILLSVAVLGLGLGAFLHYRKPKRLASIDPAWLLLSAAAVALILAVTFATTVSQYWWAAYLLLSLSLFVFIGAFLSHVFSAMTEHSGFLYWADLSGAAVGVFLALALVNVLGGTNALLAAALLLSASSCFYRPTFRPSYVLAVGLAVLITTNHFTGIVDLEMARTDSQKTIAAALDKNGLDGEIIFSDWDAFARIDVVAYPDMPGERTLFVDGGSGSAIFKLEGGLESLSFLRNDLGYLPFELVEPETVFIVGPGGGKDILLGLLSGSNTITAVEISPGIVRAMDALKEYHGDIYYHPGVDLQVAEGRSYLKSAGQKYDLIYLSLVANEAADLAGLALSENYIYTEEAFRDYREHLTPRGAYALRLHDEPHLQRAFVTVLNSLASQGFSTVEAAQHVLVLAGQPHPGSPALIDPLLVVFAEPISASDATAIHEKAVAAGLQPLLIPHVTAELPYAAFSEGQITIGEFIGRLPNSSYAMPTTDDRPFFYLLHGGLPDQLTILIVLLSVCAAAWAFYLSSIERGLRPGRGKQKRPPRLGVWWIYFALTGFGFMMLEVNLLQRFSLFLGHPVRSLVIILAGLLLSSGLGSFLTRNLDGNNGLVFVRRVLIGIPLLGLVYLLVLPYLLQSLHGTALLSRSLVTLGLIAPLGFLLGIPFPVGLRMLVSRTSSEKVALAWATNGLFSVIGSVSATAIAILAGFQWVWLAALAGYFLLAALSLGPLKSQVAA